MKDVLLKGNSTVKNMVLKERMKSPDKSLEIFENQHRVDQKGNLKYKIGRKGTTSYAFMKSQVIDNANRARKKKNKNIIILKNKRKLSNEETENNFSRSLHNYSMNKESNSLILLKKHNQKPTIIQTKDIKANNSLSKIYYSKEGRNKNSSHILDKRSRSVAALNPVKINAHSVPPSKIRFPEKRYKNKYKAPKKLAYLPPKTIVKRTGK